MENFKPTEKTRLRRLPKRGEFDRAAVYAILDEGFVCHVGFVVDGQPFVIPTGYARDGNQLFIHGSQASRMLRELRGGVEVCVTVTLIDGLVMARSAFHHSMNYRSVVILGRAQVVDEPAEKMKALHSLTEHMAPGRWEQARKPNESEMKATMVLKLPLVEVSAKVRTGPPVDDEEDYSLPVWAGVLPLTVATGTPVNDARLPAGIEPPSNVKGYRRTA